MPLTPDVCILGSGPVGLTLARALIEKGHQVTVLEIGGASTALPSKSRPIHFDRRTYRGATDGRAVGLGGTSSLWGGQLLPVRPDDLIARIAINAPAWPILHDEITPYFLELQHWLGIEGSDFDLSCLRNRSHPLLRLDYTDWTPRLSKWLEFGARNIATAWRTYFNASPGLQLWLNAESGGWRFSETPADRTVQEIIAQSTSGQTLKIQPKRVVIAAGALESARIVFAMNAAAGCLSAGVSELTGRFLHDHLSVRIARVQILDERLFQRHFAPVFEGPTMRSLRMELAPHILDSEGLPGLYAHFVGQAPKLSGFAVVRDLLRSIQQGNLHSAFTAVMQVPRALPSIAKLIYARFLQHRLEYPAGGELYLHVDFEQAPRRENRFFLGETAADGHRAAHIDWDLPLETARVARRVQRHFEHFWKRNGLDRIAMLQFIDLGDDPEAWASNVHDIYHPAGTTRMATDPSQGVVDANLRIHGTSNAFVVGSSVFPSMGAANPTFTAMALALRLADFIDRESRRA
jgi:choline dehydrogenase-like flavoprotein